MIMISLILREKASKQNYSEFIDEVEATLCVQGCRRRKDLQDLDLAGIEAKSSTPKCLLLLLVLPE